MTQYTKTDQYGTVRYYSDADCTVRHRILGPAVEWADGDRFWFLNGKVHRTDGPAVEYAGGDRVWYLNGDPLTFSTWLVQTPVTEAERLILALKYSEHA